MSYPSKKSSSRTSTTSGSVFYSPETVEKHKTRESKIHPHTGSNIEHKLQTLRTLILGYEVTPTTQASIVEPLKPMPYIRHFNVSKKSRSLRFFFKI